MEEATCRQQRRDWAWRDAAARPSGAPRPDGRGTSRRLATSQRRLTCSDSGRTCKSGTNTLSATGTVPMALVTDGVLRPAGACAGGSAYGRAHLAAPDREHRLRLALRKQKRPASSAPVPAVPQTLGGARRRAGDAFSERLPARCQDLSIGAWSVGSSRRRALFFLRREPERRRTSARRLRSESPERYRRRVASVRVAAVQDSPVLLDQAATLDRVDELTDRAAEQARSSTRC